MIVELNQIDPYTNEGKLLLAAIAKIMENQTDKTPNKIIGQLDKLALKMGTPQMSPCPECMKQVTQEELGGFSGICEDCDTEVEFRDNG